MLTPSITIIIATYNASGTLAACLDSIVSQKLKNYEILIIDGMSTDCTVELVKAYSRLHNNIRWISEKDNGIYDAMNKGIKMAKGEWLYFLGSDDKLFNHDVLSNVKGYLTDSNDIVYGNSVWVPEEKAEEGEWPYSQLLKQSINHQRIFYRKSLFERFGLYNTDYIIAADHECNIRFFCQPGVNKKYVNTQVAYYHSGGFTANKIDEKFWQDWKQILLKNFKPYLTKKQIYERVSWYCWHNIQKKSYTKAISLFCDIYLHTGNFKFVKHTLSQTLKTFKI